MPFSPLQQFTIQRGIGLFITTALILGVAWYMFFQARNLIAGPEIHLETDPGVLQTDRIITIIGTTRNITELTLNGRDIHTDEAGRFSQPLVLENGYTIMTLSAKDRYGRMTSLSRSFVYRE